MDVCRDGRMDEWMVGLDGWMGVWKNQWTKVWMFGIVELMDEWMDRCLDGWDRCMVEMNGRDGFMDGFHCWMNGRMG